MKMHDSIFETGWTGRRHTLIEESCNKVLRRASSALLLTTEKDGIFGSSCMLTVKGWSMVQFAGTSI
jgi:hypothetical protein